MLEAQQLAAQRGGVPLFTVAFALQRGEALVVTGANGSGKTTLLRIVAGLTLPAAGTLAWNGAAVTPFDPTLRAMTLYIGHATALKDELSAEENLVSLATLHGANVDAVQARAALADWALERHRSLPARVLSQGQRRRVGLARLRLVRRPLWVLDEPTTALDTAGVAILQELVAAHLAQGGVAVIATHHDLELPLGTMKALTLS
ncbi:MAG TPA: cytochrome c biogenesis heme-transporting ATPase CcmA [Casimicrobiaceae bacterium]|nr:cytochrome c biogenesis heme-transporting ATPase CcmA [Casimicrobiaceae bacterium]